MKVFAPPTELSLPDFSDFKDADGRHDFTALMQAEEEYLARVVEYAKTEPHPLAGEVVATPMGDGSAVYVVAKVNGSVCLLHIATGDAWHDDQWCRLMTVTELKRMVAADKRLLALFAKPAEAAVPA